MEPRFLESTRQDIKRSLLVHTSFVEGEHGRTRAAREDDVVTLAEDTAPQGLVEVPDNAFDLCDLRRVTLWRYGLSPPTRARWSPRACSAIKSSSTSELPSMISITRASRKQRWTGCSSDRPSAPWICTA